MKIVLQNNRCYTSCEKGNGATKMKDYICSNCGCSVSEEYNYCPECGSPMNDTCSLDDDLTDTFLGTKKKEEKREKKKRSPIRRLIFWAIVIALAIWGKLEYDAYDYGINLHNVGYYASTSASQLDKAGVLFINVWNNTVFQTKDEETDKYTREANGTGNFYSDFNDALEVLVNSQEYKDRISQAEEAKNEAYDLMGKLTNPPRRYEDAYRDVKSYYTDFIAFYNIVVSPRGTLAEHREKFEKARDVYIQSSYAISMY